MNCETFERIFFVKNVCGVGEEGGRRGELGWQWRGWGWDFLCLVLWLGVFVSGRERGGGGELREGVVSFFFFFFFRISGGFFLVVWFWVASVVGVVCGFS